LKLNIPIIFEDQQIVVINKPAGLASIPGRGEKTSVVELIAAQTNLPFTGNTDPRIRVVHRLDKDTSGVLVFAKTIEVQRCLSHQFQNNLAGKKYLALVVGKPLDKEGEINAPLEADRRRPGAMKVFKRGKPAKTHWRVEKTYRGLSLLRVFPKSGKTHQIRVHLQYLGHPLAVDSLYGPPPDEQGPGIFLSRFKKKYQLGKYQQERPLISRLTLHAESLEIELPDGKRQLFTAPLPKDFLATIRMLDKYAL